MNSRLGLIARARRRVWEWEAVYDRLEGLRGMHTAMMRVVLVWRRRRLRGDAGT